jgi:hypothetical protein
MHWVSVKFPHPPAYWSPGQLLAEQGRHSLLTVSLPVHRQFRKKPLTHVPGLVQFTHAAST